MLRVGLIGYGAIGSEVVRLARSLAASELEFVSALVRDPARHRRPGTARDPALPMITRVEDLLASRPEVVAEVAGHEALRAHGPAVLRAGVDLVLVSAGALSDEPTLESLLAAAREGGSRMRVASGAIGALDALAAAALGGLEHVTHTTHKPARTLLDATQTERLTGPQLLYRGPARAGVRQFPESVNVAAAVSLAGIGFDRTVLCVVADPALEVNRHVVEAEGAFGQLRFEIENVPTQQNPRTGRIVAMSVLHELRKRQAAFAVG